jgi:hypothetical protein
MLFSRVVALVYIPTIIVCESYFFLASLSTPVGGGVFDDNYSNRGKVES